MDGRQLTGQADVALVLAEKQRPGLGHDEVRPGDAHVGSEEALAQVFAHQAGESLGILGGIDHRHGLGDQLDHLLFGAVDGRHHQVAGTFPRQLDDALAQIGLDHLDVELLEGLVEVDLF